MEPVLSKDDQGRALWYYQIKDSKGNYIKSAEAGDIPSFVDIYKQVKGTPSGWEWEAFDTWFNGPWTALKALYGPPNVDQSLIEVLRKGFLVFLRLETRL